jgi:hypothetical protein
MTNEERKAWIDQASYPELLYNWRFEPSGSPWFEGELGQYYKKMLLEKKAGSPPGEQVSISKALGWG